MAKTPTKFVEPLSEDEKEDLWGFVCHGTTLRMRHRAHAILLSDLKRSVEDIAQIFRVCTKTAASWIDRWNELGMDGLDDAPRSGGPPALSDKERETVLEILGESPQSPKTVLNEIPKRLEGKTISGSTLRRIARAANLCWKRVRRSLKSRRDEDEFRAAQDEIRELVHLHGEGQFDLYFFDEAGFSLVPTVPYAWQPVGERLEIPSQRSRRLNVLGFLGLSQQLSCFTVEGNVDSSCILTAMDAFAKTLQRTALVVLDNASIHHSAAFDNRLEQWAEQGLLFYFLPPYCPELNLIEKLWKMIKYHWLPLSAYESFQHLVESVDDVLNKIGSYYKLAFSSDSMFAGKNS